MSDPKAKSIDSLAFDKMSFGYDDGQPLFNDITLELPKAKAVWVNTRSGERGRSTIMRILAGLTMPTQGSYLINGENVSQMSFEEFLPYRLHIGYGFDMGGLLNNRTMFENLSLPLRYHGHFSQDEVISKVSRTMDFFQIARMRNQKPFGVSGSQRKLACVVRAFIHEPQVVFLDDPMNGLKDGDVTRLLQHIQDGFASRGLKQVYFTAEKNYLAEQLKAEELLLGSHFFKIRPVAA